MELNISKQPVYIRETLLEAELEQPVECDVLLPDYCDDIQKILKCTLEPVFTRRQAEGTRLELEGICLVTVYYRSPQGRLCRGEYKVPFARTAELRGEAACPVIWTQGVCGYVSCRAVSSRRLDIRGAATLRAAVANLREQQAVASAEGTGVQLRQCSCQGTRVLLQASRTVSLCEDVELPESKGGVEAVLRVGAAARLLDCRVMAGKVILRGEAAVSCLYRTPEGRCETMDFTLPLSQMVDADCADDQCRCFARLEVQHAAVERRSEAGGEERLLTVTASVEARVLVHRDYQALCASDCYSTKYECSCRTARVELPQLVQEVDRTFLYRGRLDLPEGVDRITGLWCQVADWSVREEGGDLAVAGRLRVSLFGQQGEGEMEYYEKLVEFEERVPLGDAGGGSAVFRPSLWAAGQSYSFSGEGGLEVRCEVGLAGCLYRCRSISLIGDLALDETRLRESRVQKGLYVCMAEAGEELWDIARRYNTSVDYILEENDLTAGALEQRTMLLVPVL